MNSCEDGEVKKAVTSSTKLVWLEVCEITSISNFAIIVCTNVIFNIIFITFTIIFVTTPKFSQVCTNPGLRLLDLEKVSTEE